MTPHAQCTASSRASVPDNLTLLALPPKCRVNRAENVGHFHARQLALEPGVRRLPRRPRSLLAGPGTSSLNGAGTIISIGTHDWTKRF